VSTNTTAITLFFVEVERDILDGDFLNGDIVPKRVGGSASETCALQEETSLSAFIGIAVYPIGNKKAVILALFWETLTLKPVTTDMTVLSGNMPGSIVHNPTRLTEPQSLGNL
jgi:hypothetical protein